MAKTVWIVVDTDSDGPGYSAHATRDGAVKQAAWLVRYHAEIGEFDFDGDEFDDDNPKEAILSAMQREDYDEVLAIRERYVCAFGVADRTIEIVEAVLIEEEE
jgi:hypothetical protein